MTKMVCFNSFVLLFCFVPLFAQKMVDINFNGKYISESRFKRALKKGPALSKTCVTPVCQYAASKILGAMNHNADACEEFDELICGNKIEENGFTMENFRVLENFIKTEINRTSEKFLHVFKTFYESCIGYDLDFGLLQNLDFVKTLPATDITGVFVESILTQSMMFFDVGLDIAAVDETYQFLLTLPGESYLKTHTIGWSILEESKEECLDKAQDSVVSKNVDINQMYTEYTKCKQEILFNYAENFETVMKLTNRLTDNEMYLKELLELYLKYQVSEEVIRNAKLSKTPTMTIDEIQAQYGVINWKSFFEKLATNKTFVGNETIFVAFPGYFQNIFDALKKYEPGKLMKMFQELTTFQLFRNLLLVRRNANRKLYCMDLTHQLMPDVVSWILYDIAGRLKMHVAVYQTNAMFVELKKMLKNSFQDSSLDDMSKEKFIKKIDKISLGLISLGDANITRENYRFVKVNHNYRINLINILKNYRRFLYNIVGYKSSPATLLNFFVDAFHTRPTTFYPSHSIVLHPEILKKLPSSLPENIRLAKLGFFLAQALARHFDPTGRLFMTDDIRSNEEYYDTLVTHTTEIFDQYYLKNPFYFHRNILKFKPVNGKQFANEIISDNAAFRLITDYFAKVKQPKELPWLLNDHITLNQTFFMAVAQEFCDDQLESTFMINLLEKGKLPSSIKIKNIMSNSNFCSETFHCLEGSSFWLDPSVIRQFPQDTEDDYEDGGQIAGQYD